MTSALEHATPDRPWTRIAAARLVLLGELLGPALLAVIGPPLLLVVAGLFGVWQALPVAMHWAAIAAGLGASAVGIRRVVARVQWPSEQAALRRLEEDGGVAHDALRALADSPFGADPAHPLWRAHLDDMIRRSAGARVRGARPTGDVIDPWGVRFMMPGLLVVALVIAGPDWRARIAEAFAPASNDQVRVAAPDIWIEPPAYTGRAPIVIARSTVNPVGVEGQIDVPSGSKVWMQGGQRSDSLGFQTPTRRVSASFADGVSGGAQRKSLILDESGVLRLKSRALNARWAIGVIPDFAPSVRFISTPSGTGSGRLAVEFEIQDDYGAERVELVLTLHTEQARPLDAPAFSPAAAQVPRVLTLPEAAGAMGPRRHEIDVEAEPWAGLTVDGVLRVTDAAGQTATSAPARFVLPQRRFLNPLARAVVEQRQSLAVAPETWRRTLTAFSGLTLAPDRFFDTPSDYLLLRAAMWRVSANDSGDFTSTVEDFWPLALHLENEQLETARQKLQAAAEALRDALANAADDATISMLTEALREAMRDYMQALAQSGDAIAEDGQTADSVLNESDLDELLDSIRDLAQSGASNAARQALDDLERLLNNLRLSSTGSEGQSGGGQSGGTDGQRGSSSAGAAGDLIGRQREISNRTFERRRSDAPADDLQAQENALARDLSALIESLSGADENTRAGRQSLESALSEMQTAESALGANNLGAAGAAMERAINSLRDGAGRLAESEARAAATGRGGQDQIARDPLGRVMGAPTGEGVEVPTLSDPQRAREILLELRRRLSDGGRSDEEVRYLERLLERF